MSNQATDSQHATQAGTLTNEPKTVSAGGNISREETINTHDSEAMASEDHSVDNSITKDIEKVEETSSEPEHEVHDGRSDQRPSQKHAETGIEKEGSNEERKM